MTGLTLALFFLVLARMQRGQISTESYLQDCGRACAVANEHDDDEDDDVNAHVTKEQVDEWIKTASSENWTTGQEWWSSVPENIFDRAVQEPMDGVEEDVDIDSNISSSRKRWRQTVDTGEDPEGVLLPGLGTMMQDSVGWLSEDRRADYWDWQADFEKRLDRMLNEHRRTKRTKGKAVAVT